MKKIKFLLLSIFLVITVSATASSTTLKEAQNLIKTYADNRLDSIKQLPIDPAYQDNLTASWVNNFTLPINYTTNYTAEPSPSTFIITGGWECYGPPNQNISDNPPGTMSEMWIRDAIAQLHSYLPIFQEKTVYNAKQIAALQKIMEGFILNATNLLNQYPLAHAFTSTIENNTRVDSSGTDYELDTPAFFIWFINDYYTAAGDKKIFTAKLTDTIGKLLYNVELGQKEQFNYDNTTNKRVIINPSLCTKNCIGLSSSYTRPSDDKLLLPYSVPDNMLLEVALQQIQKLPLVDGTQQSAHEVKVLAKKLAEQIEKGLRFAIVNTASHGKMYAFETDGKGQAADNTFTGDGVQQDFELNFTPYQGDAPFNDAAKSIEVTETMGKTTTALIPEKDYVVNGTKTLHLNHALSAGTTLIVRGNFVFMDDANLPSLLSSPYFNFIKPYNPIYLHTRQFVLSNDNPYYFQSDYYRGEGSPHIATYTSTMLNNAWPLGLVAQGMTSNITDEKKRVLEMLLKVAVNPNDNAFACTSSEYQAKYPAENYMRESFSVSDPEKYTRGYFAWSDAFYAEWLNKWANSNANSLLLRGSSNRLDN